MFSSARPFVAPGPLRLPSCFFVACILLGLVAGCATERFKTHARVDTTYDFSAVRTFAFDVRREKVANSVNGKFVENALREGLLARGYEEVDKSGADVLFSYDIGVYAWGGLSGANQRTRQHGDITVWVYDAASGKNIWYGWADTALRSGDEPEPTINAAVAAIFDQRVPNSAKSK